MQNTTFITFATFLITACAPAGEGTPVDAADGIYEIAAYELVEHTCEGDGEDRLAALGHRFVALRGRDFYGDRQVRILRCEDAAQCRDYDADAGVPEHSSDDDLDMHGALVTAVGCGYFGLSIRSGTWPRINVYERLQGDRDGGFTLRRYPHVAEGVEDGVIERPCDGAALSEDCIGLETLRLVRVGDL